MPGSSSGPGHRPLTAKITGSNPVPGTKFSSVCRLQHQEFPTSNVQRRAITSLSQNPLRIAYQAAHSCLTTAKRMKPFVRLTLSRTSSSDVRKHKLSQLAMMVSPRIPLSVLLPTSPFTLFMRSSPYVAPATSWSIFVEPFFSFTRSQLAVVGNSLVVCQTEPSLSANSTARFYSVASGFPQ